MRTEAPIAPLAGATLANRDRVRVTLIVISVLVIVWPIMRWTERPDARRVLALPRGPQVGSRPIATVLAASLLLAAAWPVAAAWIESRVDARPIEIEAIVPRAGWQTAARAAASATDWTPELVAPTAVNVQTLVRDGSAVSVYRAMYRGQTQGAELVNTMNQIASSESKHWRLMESGTAQVRANGQPKRVRTALVRGANEQFLIWQWYWLAGSTTTTTSDLRVKMQLAWQRLTAAPDTAAWVAVYTLVGDDVGVGVRTLTSFVEAMSGPIDAALEATAGR